MRADEAHSRSKALAPSGVPSNLHSFQRATLGFSRKWSRSESAGVRTSPRSVSSLFEGRESVSGRPNQPEVSTDDVVASAVVPNPAVNRLT